MLLLKEEKDALKLWQPTNSQFVKDTHWVQANFPSKVTVNVLTSDFLSDPGPIIVYPCQWLTHSLTDDLVEDLMKWPKCADFADYVDYADFAEYA